MPDHELSGELCEIVADLVYVGRQQRQVVDVAVAGPDWIVNKQNVRLVHLYI